MQTKHTPGPWFTAATSRIGHAYIVDADGFTIAEPSPMGEANARLIAAAPELLAALQAIMDDPDAVDHILHLDAVAADAAIAKATGGQP